MKKKKKESRVQDKCHAGLLNLKGCLFPLRSQIDQNNFFDFNQGIKSTV
jgi:hypothetical protein